MLPKNKNNNAKSTIAVCLIGAVVLMGYAGCVLRHVNLYKIPGV